MCQYSSETEDGQPGIWHNIHYGTRAVGGAGLVMIEATSVQAEGRITPWDLGIWSDDHTDTYRPIVDAINSRGATPAIQLALPDARPPMTNHGLVEPPWTWPMAVGRSSPPVR